MQHFEDVLLEASDVGQQLVVRKGGVFVGLRQLRAKLRRRSKKTDASEKRIEAKALRVEEQSKERRKIVKFT